MGYLSKCSSFDIMIDVIKIVCVGKCYIEYSLVI